MGEWVLAVTLTFSSGTPGVVRDGSLSTVEGFTSEARCKAAGDKLAETLIRLGSKSRERAGIARSASVSIPEIWFECVQLAR